ncbi:MAG: hypothetical protein JWO38_3606 [Gemmataceae bacterium]|nr:hypothetical protein [Gemmataceae bacterium]
MSSKNLFRRLMTKSLRQGPTRPIRGRKTALGIETLEDRVTPAVTAAVVVTDLQVNLGAANDTANLTLNGTNIEVRDQANTLILTTPAASVTDFDITGTNTGTQTVNLVDSFTLTGHINIGVGAGNQVSDITFGSPETAGSVDAEATNDASVQSVAAAGPVTLLADGDNSGVGTFTLNANASITTGNNGLTVGGAGITFGAGSNITTGTGNVFIDSSTSNFVYTAPATNVITNTSGSLILTSYDPAPRVWAADTTVASFTGSYVLFFQRAASLTLNGINTSAAGNHIQVNVGVNSVGGGDLSIGGAVTAGTGSVFLNADNAGITDPGGATVTGSSLNVSAQTGIGASGTPLVTAVGQLQATNATSGGIFVANTGALSVVGTGVKANTAGDIALSSTGTLSATTLGAPITAANGNISVTTTGATSDILLGGNQTAIRTFSAGNNVTLTAGEDVVFGSGVSGHADVTVDGNLQVLPARDAIFDNNSLVDVTNGGAGTATVTAGRNVSFQHTTFNGTFLHTTGGAITVTTAANGAFTLDAAGGSLDSAGGLITVNANTMLIKDTINAGAGAVAITMTGSAGTVTVNGPISGSSATITGSSGGDTFNLQSDTGNVLLAVNGAGGADTYTVQTTSATAPVAIHGQGGTDTVTIGNAGSVQGIAGTVSVDNFGGSTALTIDDSTDATARTVTATNAQVTGLAPATISYTANDLIALTVDGGSGGNTFNVTSTIFSSANTFNGGTGNDTLNITVTGLGANSVNAFNGQAGSDTIAVTEGTPAALVTLNVDGGGQAGDVLNVNDQTNAAATTYGITTTQVTVTGEQTVNYTGLTLGSVVVHAGSGSNAINATGSAAANLTVNGGNGITTWTINGPGLQAGSTNIFNGGNQAGTTGDTFTVTPATAAGTAITVNGNGPSSVSPGDTLNIDAGGAGVAITPTGFTVNGGQTISTTGIETVHLTNAGAVTVAGANTPNTLSLTSLGASSAQVTLNGGPAIVVSSVTSFTFDGGTGNDTMTLVNNGVLFAPTGGIFYNGGGHTSVPGDTLQVTGSLGVFVSGTYTVLPSGPNGNAGTLTYTQGLTTQTIQFTGLQPIEDLTTLGSFTVTGPAVGGTTNIVTGPTSTGNDPVTGLPATTYEINFTPSDGSTAEAYRFRNKTVVTFNGSNSTTPGQQDLITVDLPTQVDASSPTKLNNLTINPMNSPAGDRVNVTATPAGVGTAVVAGVGNNDSIDIGFPGAVPGTGSLDAILGFVSVQGSGGTGTTLTVDDTAHVAARTAVDFQNFAILGGTGAGPTGGVPIGYFGTFALIDYRLGSGDDTIRVDSTSSTVANTTIRGNNGNDTFTLGSPANSLDGFLGPLNIEGDANTAAGDAIVVHATGDGAGNTYTVTSNTIDRTGIATIGYTTVESLALNTSTNADVINIQSTLATTPVTVNAGGGDDTVIVGNAGSLDGILGGMNVVGGGGANDQLIVDDSANPAAHAFTVTGTTVTRDGIATIAYDTTSEFLTVNGGTGGNTFDVLSTSVDTTINSGTGSDTVNLGNAGLTSGINSQLTVFGQAGLDTITLDNTADPGPTTYHLASGEIGGGAYGGPVTPGGPFGANGLLAYTAATEVVNVNGGTGTNTYNVDETIAATNTTINDGAGNGTFNIAGNGLAGTLGNFFNGNGGTDTFNLQAAALFNGGAVITAPVSIDGGAPATPVDPTFPAAPPAAGNGDVVTITGTGDDNIVYFLDSAGGAGHLTGLGSLVALDLVEQVLVDGGPGNGETLTLVDNTGFPHGSLAAAQNGIVVAPTGPNSARVVVDNGPATFSPVVYLANISNTGFMVTGSGVTQEVLTVLAPSENGLGSGAPFFEPTFPSGNNFIAVSDSNVSILNTAVGQLLQVGVSTPTFTGLVVEGGNQGPTGGDVFDVIPSNQLSILLDGRNPAPPIPAGSFGDVVNLFAAGIAKVYNDPTLGPPVLRFEDVNPITGAAATVAFTNMETVNVSSNIGQLQVIGDRGAGTVGGGAGTPKQDVIGITGTDFEAGTVHMNEVGSGQPDGVFHFDNILSLQVNTFALNDAVSITPFATANEPWSIDVTVDGGTSTGGPGDTLTYVAAPGITNNTDLVVTAANAGNLDAHGIGSATTDHVVRFSNIQTVTVNDGTNAGAFGDTLAIDLANGTTNDAAAFQFADPINHTTPDITLSDDAATLLQVNMDSGNIPALTVNGNATADMFDVFATYLPAGTRLPVALTVHGGTGGTNTLTLHGTTGQDNTFTNIAGANPTSGTATLTGGAGARVVYTGLPDPTFVGGGGASADVLNLSGSGTLSVTGTGPGAGTASITGQSGITFSNFGTASTINLTGAGGPDVFTVKQPVGWGIPTVNVTEAPASATAILQLVATTNSDTINYDPGTAVISIDDGSGATGVTHYNAAGINSFAVDGNTPVAPTLPGDTLIVSSFLSGTASLPSGILGTIPRIAYQNIETIQVGALPTAGVTNVTATAGTPITFQPGVTVSNQPYTILIVTGPAHGTAVVNPANPPTTPNQSITYTPNSNYFGADTITYRVVDANGQMSPVGTISITVLAIAHTPTVTVTSPGAENENSAVPVTITAALSPSANPAEVLSVTISGVPANATFSAGTNAGGGVWAFTPAQLAGLTITDRDGPATLNLTVTATSSMPGLLPAQVGVPATATATAALLVTVLNVAPTATGLSNSGPVPEGSPVTVTLNGATDVSPVDAAALRYSFALQPGNLLSTYAASGPANTAQYTFPAHGTYTIWARVIDKDGGFNDYQTTVTVQVIAHAPTLSVNSNPLAATEGTPAPVSIVVTKNPQADPAESLSYQITGVLANATFNHGVNAGGGVWTFNAADLTGLTLTDVDGPATLNLTVSAISTVNTAGIPPAEVGPVGQLTATTSAPLTVNVANVAPTATFAVTGPFVPGQTFAVAFTNPFDPSPVDTAAGFTYQYDLGTGTFGPVTTSPTATFTPPAAGSYTIRGKIIDKDGGFTIYTANTPGAQPGQVVVPNVDVYAVGDGIGGGPIVHVYSAATNTLVASFSAYEPTFRGGVTVAVADLNGDGIPDIITGTGPGGGPVVKVFDGKTFALLGSFFAYEPTFRGGVTVAAGQVGGKAVIVTGSGVGGGPVVKTFDGTTFAPLASFMAYDPSARGGVNVAVADPLGTGQGEIITGAGAGAGPHVKVFDGSGGLLQSFFAYDPSFTGGVTVSGGDLFGSGHADIVTGTGAGGGGNLRVFDGQTDALVKSTFAFGPDRITGGSLRNGFTVSASHIGGVNGKPIVLAAAGPDFGPTVRVFDATLTNPLAELVPYEDTFTGGAYVG